MSCNEGSSLERKEGLKNEASGRVHLLPYWGSEQALDHKLKNRVILPRVPQVSGSLTVGCHYSWVRGEEGGYDLLSLVSPGGREQWSRAEATGSLGNHLTECPALAEAP